MKSLCKEDVVWSKALRFWTPVLGVVGATQAFAQEGAPAQPDPIKGLLLNLPVFLALFLLFYFGLIHPQKNQQKKHQEFLSRLNKGDEVVTSSGIIGTIRGLTEKVVTLEVSPGSEIKVLRSQVQSFIKDSLTQP